jgi:hypothetical protein
MSDTVAASSDLPEVAYPPALAARAVAAERVMTRQTIVPSRRGRAGAPATASD